MEKGFVKPSRLRDLYQESSLGGCVLATSLEIVAIMQKATHDFVLAPTIGKRAKENK